MPGERRAITDRAYISLNGPPVPRASKCRSASAALITQGLEKSMPVFRATLKRGYFKAQAELPPIDYMYIHFNPCKVLPISPIVVA